MNIMEPPAIMAPGQQIPTLEKTASDPRIDPCHVACDAMAAHVAGDLCEKDEHWLHKHAEVCSYCANELRRYNKLDSALAACGGI